MSTQDRSLRRYPPGHPDATTSRCSRSSRPIRHASTPSTGAGAPRRIRPFGGDLWRPLGGRHAGRRDGQVRRPAELRGSNQHRNIEKRFTRVHADTIRYEFRVTNPTILVEINRNLECQAGEAASGGGSRWRSATVHHPPILGAAHVQ